MIRVAGHFGELLQGRIGPSGQVALITLPCPALAVVARHRPGTGLTLHDDSQTIVSLDRVHKFLQGLGLSLSGRLDLCAEMPVGGGAGASTAALVALARLAGYCGKPQALAAACIASEGASDSLMFNRPEQMLWASRTGDRLADLPPLPRFEVVGGFYGPPCPTDAADNDFPDITALIPRWIRAAHARDLVSLAALATHSAKCTLKMRKPQSDPTASLARQLGALGYVIAHTGSARGLIFAPDKVPAQARAVLQDAGLCGIVQFFVGDER